jgi:hypothetical protein
MVLVVFLDSIVPSGHLLDDRFPDLESGRGGGRWCVADVQRPVAFHDEEIVDEPAVI